MYPKGSDHMNIPILETVHLILRPLTIADAPAVFEWVSDPNVTKFMPYNTYTNVDDVIAWLRCVEAETQIYNFGFVRKSDGKLIGSGSIVPKNNAWEFGYNIRHDCWNQGYTTEAAREMIRFARDEKGASAFTAAHAVDNPASGRVIEKCGLRFDHWGSYSSFDDTRTFSAKFYTCTAADTRSVAKIAVKAPTIETDRLILRALTAADAPAVFEWVSDPIVTKYMPYNTYTNIDDVTEWLRAVEIETHNYNFAFVRKSDGKVIGSGDIGPNDENSAWEFGYNIRHDCWNNGYATEAARAMIAFAHNTMGVTSFAANHAAENPASGRVMEKCGLHFDHDGSYSSFDGTRNFPAKFYTGTADEISI